MASITIKLDKEVEDILKKRAKKELFTVHELIEDILRRSAISWTGGKPGPRKVDDKMLLYFSRENRGKKSKKSKIKKKKKK